MLNLLSLIVFCALPLIDSDLATEQESQLATEKAREKDQMRLRFPICRSAIGQTSCLICACRRKLRFPFCC